jgi:hypothetical protein
MTEERRTDAQIRADIAAERARLGNALTDLREGMSRKRDLAKGIGGAIAAGVAALVAARIVRRLRHD